MLECLAVLNNIIALLTIYIRALLLTYNIETKLNHPFSRSFDQYFSWKPRLKCLIEEEIIFTPLTKLADSTVRLSLNTSIFSNVPSSFLVEALIRHLTFDISPAYFQGPLLPPEGVSSTYVQSCQRSVITHLCLVGPGTSPLCDLGDES